MTGWLTPLFVPGDRPDRVAKAAASGADAVVIDLEDAVAPSARPGARDALGDTVARAGACPVIVRINARDTEWHLADLRALAGLPVAAVMLPKTEQAGDIASVRATLPHPVIALIETARGLAQARAIAASQGVAGLAFGSVDFCADLGLAHERAPLLSARFELVLASRLAGLAPPLDGVTTALDDPAAIEEDSRYAASLGFGGKLCIHPRQIAPARRGFAPTPDEIAWARRVLDAGAEGAAAVDGHMVDAPVLVRARRILARVSHTGSRGG